MSEGIPVSIVQQEGESEIDIAKLLIMQSYLYCQYSKMQLLLNLSNDFRLRGRLLHHNLGILSLNQSPVNRQDKHLPTCPKLMKVALIQGLDNIQYWHTPQQISRLFKTNTCPHTSHRCLSHTRSHYRQQVLRSYIPTHPRLYTSTGAGVIHAYTSLSHMCNLGHVCAHIPRPYA